MFTEIACSLVSKERSGLTQAELSENAARELQEIRKLLWGPNIRVDVFRRWSQGK